MTRPVLFVLAGVNGAGKSSIGGHLLERAGMAWFNPDTYARELHAATGCALADANAAAWHEGMRRLEIAVSAGQSHAFETTLGGNSVAAALHAASRSHDVLVWFCGLASPEQHIARVAARVVAGGHAIAEAKIRERWPRARENLIALMPHLAQLQVHDNSVDVAAGRAIPDPTLLLEMVGGQLMRPAADDIDALRAIPDWAKPLVEAALDPPR